MAEEVDVNSFIVQCGAATAEEAATACRVLEEHGLGELLKRLITSDQTQIQQLTFTLEEAKSEREILMLTSGGVFIFVVCRQADRQTDRQTDRWIRMTSSDERSI